MRRARLVLPGEDYDTDVESLTVVSGVLVVEDQDETTYFAPGEWLRATVERGD